MLPTGGGKSAIYELAGMLRAGPTVVVSPLIALQDDQLAHLRAAGLRAIVVNSQQAASARAAALLASCDSDTFVFLAPEQLAKGETRDTLRRAGPGLFAVDEAHLISQWGHDFRPDYLLLGAQAASLGAPVRLALTATAAPPVRQEIIRRLGLRDPVVVIGDFDRPHLHLSAHHVSTIPDKERELVRAAREFAGPGIVYAATHASAQAAHDALASAGERVTLYHAGRSGRERRQAMTAFLDGSARIIAATVAFGMGIDKPDVRWVLHADPPPSPDAYYQEIGRAGRDGQLLYGALLFQVTGQQLSVPATRRILARIEALFDGHLPSPAELLEVDPGQLREAGLSWRKISTLRDLAGRFSDGRLNPDVLSRLPDEELMAELTAIPGIGPWTVQGALLIALQREDTALGHPRRSRRLRPPGHLPGA